MHDTALLAYVQAAAQLLALPLDDTRAQAVAQHLGRTQAMAQQLEALAMPLEQEPTELFCPAPFPPTDPEATAV